MLNKSEFNFLTIESVVPVICPAFRSNNEYIIAVVCLICCTLAATGSTMKFFDYNMDMDEDWAQAHFEL